jgi:hypothetical protein
MITVTVQLAAKFTRSSTTLRKYSINWRLSAMTVAEVRRDR